MSNTHDLLGLPTNRGLVPQHQGRCVEIGWRKNAAGRVPPEVMQLTKRYQLDELIVLCGREPWMTPGGIWVERWHLSISHQRRDPMWAEIHAARYQLVPDGVTMVMILPPSSEYVNVHQFCFHLHECPEIADRVR